MSQMVYMAPLKRFLIRIAGDPNPKVKMGIADVATAKTVWVKTDYTVDQYIAWPFWTPDSKKLASPGP